MKIKNILKITCCLLFVSCLCCADAFSFSSGDGSAGNPFLISNNADWQTFADSVHSGTSWSRNRHFKLTNNLYNISTSIGTGLPANSFYGHFNGDNYTITATNMLFGYIEAEGVVENLIVDGDISSFIYVAGIANINRGLIQNCINYASITAVLGYSGGIVLDNRGIVQNCINVGSITGNLLTAGIVTVNLGIVQNCINVGNITSNYYAGGIIGGNAYESDSDDIQQNPSVSFCLNIGSVTGGCVGGIIGAHWLDYPATITNCINSGLINCTATDHLSAFIGGIVGQCHQNLINSTTTLSNCANTGVLTANANVINIGAIAGVMEGNVVFTNNHYDKQMCVYGGVNNVDVPGTTGHLTRDMVGTKLQALLGTADWTYTDAPKLIDRLYPQLKVLSHTEASKVGAAPVFLWDGIEGEE